MHVDTTIIHRSGELLVQRHAPQVTWPDGSTLALHHMQFGNVPALLLRALQVDGQWVKLDLQSALPTLADDIRCHHRRDAQGLIHFTFRGRWGSAGACMAALRPHLRPLPAGGGAALPWPPVEPEDRLQLTFA